MLGEIDRSKGCLRSITTIYLSYYYLVTNYYKPEILAYSVWYVSC